jgi:hypothetical protein
MLARMGDIVRGLLGAGAWGGCVLTALAVVACGSSDDKSSGNSCGTQLAPGEFKVSNIMPAKGSSVPNSGIVQTFTIDGQTVQLTPTLGLAMPLHTAGAITPNPVTWHFSVAPSGTDTIYTSEAVTWATAPGHVEVYIGGQFQNPTTGCVSEFPGPMFSYDITAP